MPVLAEQELDKLATQVVDQYLSGSARLDEAAAKVASARRLNPNQIERLTQAANTQTFLRLMDKRKEAQEKDLLHEFEPIDARHVIKIVIDETGVHVEGPEPLEAKPDEDKNENENELPDEMGAVRQPRLNVEEPVKTAAAEDEPPPTPAEAWALKSRLEKLAVVMQDEMLQSSFIFEEKFDELVQRFRRRPEKYASFERDACVEHNDPLGLKLIDMMRDRLHMAQLPTKVAMEKTADYHISDDTPEMAAFEGLLHIVDHVSKLNDGLAKVKERCAR